MPNQILKSSAFLRTMQHPRLKLRATQQQKNACEVVGTWCWVKGYAVGQGQGSLFAGSVHVIIFGGSDLKKKHALELTCVSRPVFAAFHGSQDPQTGGHTVSFEQQTRC